MGTINYYTSDYITIGYNLKDIDRVEPFYSDYIEFDYYEAKSIIEKEYFNYFSVEIEPGYYEGFSINIKNNFDYSFSYDGPCFDDYSEKQRALKEATKLKMILLELVNNVGLCVVYPGWCTGYGDYKTTIKEINAAIKELKTEIKNIPTWYTLQNKGA
jgi:hypothetical protein